MAMWEATDKQLRERKEVGEWEGEMRKEWEGS